MFVSCKIKNLNTTEYPSITFRKFYQVIFWEKDLRTLKIYTAFVAGCDDNNDARVEVTDGYKLEFSFDCGNKDKCKINFVSKNDSFIKEIDTKAWKAVWGDDTHVTPTLYEYKEAQKIFNIQGTKDIRVDKDCLVVYDSSKPMSTSNAMAKIVSNFIVENENKYIIAADANHFEKTDVVNHTLTTLIFDGKDTRLNYVIELEKSQTFSALDNSIYFILPDGYDAVAEGKTASIILNDHDTELPIENPYQPLDHNKEKYLDEWIKNGILNRKYFRVDQRFKTFRGEKGKYGKFNFNVNIASFVNPIIEQLIFGLFVSLFFSYGLDQTRLMNFRTLFALYNIFPPDINFFITYSILFISIIFKISKGNTPENVFSYWARKAAIVASFAWFFWMFAIPSPLTFYGSVSIAQPDGFSTFCTSGSYILNGLALVLNALSLILICYHHKNEISFSLIEPLKKL